VETWSVDQADNYVRTLDNDMQRLREYPELGAPHPTRLANFRKLASGHHLIFYLLDGQDIEIVRILHERMDVDDKLS
jgi:toxin ParE1/3/4